MRDYQRKKNNPYYLPKTLYRRILSVIRDYDRQRQEVDDILFSTPNCEVVVSGGMPGKPTESVAIRLSQHENDIEAVEQGLIQIPEEYRDAVFNNIRYGERFPDEASRSTWFRWKREFIWHVAENLNLV